MKIQAAVAWEAGATLSIEEFDIDDPRDDEILVKVEAVGVCHTDDNARLGRLPVVFPVILGHEGAGTVERVGKDVTQVRPGDRVLFTPDYCGKCEQCVLGKTPYCDQVVAVTFTGTRPDGSPRAYSGGKPVRAAFAEGLQPFLDTLAESIPGRSKAARRRKAVATMAALVGAVTLARAVGDQRLSDEILAAAQRELLRTITS